MVTGVLARFHELLRGGPIHLTLIDPEKSDPARASELARAATSAGSNGILLGGSTGISPTRMSEVAHAVHAAVSVPIVIFPEGPGSVASGPDAIFFMSLLNSRNLDFVIRAQAKASLAVRKLRLEPIPVGYLVIAPGMRVGEVGEVDPVPRTDIGAAQGYALAAEYLGMRLVYLEAGSGAPEPVPTEMVRAVREVLAIPLIVGGGIRSGEDAAGLLTAGAQVLVTGTIAEEEGIGQSFRDILQSVRSARGD
ncbi:MAG TPA: geranylgeranylglyceryl/heptaprenylglyceryl phosphate synthase [Thermoplasmata archaeon]|nr:geranylgeranylglyceryl/heptaprenylglyceryl phosphate synthase [Thermoplasmata archaeon]